MKAANIQWDVDTGDFLDAITSMESTKAAAILCMPVECYDDMSCEQLQQYINESWKKDSRTMAELMGLPSEVTIENPCAGKNKECASDMCFRQSHDDLSEWVSDYLSDTYGFCHKGFELILEDTLSEYMVYSAHMRDAQICKSRDTDDDSQWKDYQGDLLIDTVYAPDETKAVEQVAEDYDVDADTLYAVQNTASMTAPSEERNGITKKQRMEAVSFYEQGRTGICISMDGIVIGCVYVKDGKLSMVKKETHLWDKDS